MKHCLWEWLVNDSYTLLKRELSNWWNSTLDIFYRNICIYITRPLRSSGSCYTTLIQTLTTTNILCFYSWHKFHLERTNNQITLMFALQVHAGRGNIRVCNRTPYALNKLLTYFFLSFPNWAPYFLTDSPSSASAFQTADAF